VRVAEERDISPTFNLHDLAKLETSVTSTLRTSNVQNVRHWAKVVEAGHGISVLGGRLSDGTSYGSVHFEDRDWKPKCCGLAENWGDFQGFSMKLNKELEAHGPCHFGELRHWVSQAGWL
jgi:hypothetical protein